jgi:hypothetical protein
MTMARHSEHEAQNRAMKEEAYTKLQEGCDCIRGRIC